MGYLLQPHQQTSVMEDAWKEASRSLIALSVFGNRLKMDHGMNRFESRLNCKFARIIYTLLRNSKQETIDQCITFVNRSRNIRGSCSTMLRCIVIPTLAHK